MFSDRRKQFLLTELLKRKIFKEEIYAASNFKRLHQYKFKKQAALIQILAITGKEFLYF